MRSFVVAACICGCLPVAAQTPAAPSAREARRIQKGAALGQQLADAVLRHATPLDAPAARAFVDRVGARIAAQLAGVEHSFTYHLITNDACGTAGGPASLPGGHVFIPAALFLAVQDEAEFAGLLAHSMAHVTLEHGTLDDAPRVGQLAQQGGLPLVFLGGWAGDCSGGSPLPQQYQKTWKKKETLADAAAIDAAQRAGYDPSALARYRTRVDAPPPAATASELAAVQDEVRRLIAERPVSTRTPPMLRRPDGR